MLVLASASPRRIELLRQVGLDPRVLPSRVPESRRKGESPQAMVKRLSQDKAREVATRLMATAARTKAPLQGQVLAADTTVAVGRQVLEKPSDAVHAVRMLKRLSGKSHTVYTGVCILDLARGKETAFVEATKVFFRKLSLAEIQAYVSTGEPLDKAGAYGIQGGAAAFVRRIEGDYFNVVGLPLARVVEILESMA